MGMEYKITIKSEWSGDHVPNEKTAREMAFKNDPISAVDEETLAEFIYRETIDPLGGCPVGPETFGTIIGHNPDVAFSVVAGILHGLISAHATNRPFQQDHNYPVSESFIESLGADEQGMVNQIMQGFQAAWDAAVACKQ